MVFVNPDLSSEKGVERECAKIENEVDHGEVVDVFFIVANELFQFIESISFSA